MQLEEFKDLRLSKRQYDRLARTILNRHNEKEKEERKSLEEKARTYSVQDLQEALKGTDVGISEEEVREIVKEKFGNNSGISKKMSKISLGLHCAVGGINLAVLASSFTSYAIYGEKGALIAGLANTGLLIWNSLFIYKRYREIKD